MKHHTSHETIAALTLFGLVAVAAPSHAASLELATGGQLVYEATQSAIVANHLTIAFVGGTYAIQDPAEPVISLSGGALAAGCDYFDDQTVTCPAAPIVSLAVDTKEGSDIIDLTGVLHPAMVTGGGGSDTIIGGTKDDTIVWNTFDGSDVVDGGPGTDSLFFQRGNSDGTTDGHDDDVITVLRDGAGFALHHDADDVSMGVQNVEQLLLNTFTGNDTVATTGLVGTTQFIETVYDGLPDTLTFDAADLCPFTAPGWIETPGHEAVQYVRFANVTVTNDTCVADTCDGVEATTGCTVNGVRGQRCLGTAGDDVIQGTAKADVIVGGGGRDRIYAGAGNDLACGDDGDVLQGSEGSDVLDGGRAVDTCTDVDQAGPFINCELPTAHGVSRTSPRRA
jgi:Ca2+-binding RTX toxin-like protein